MHRPNTTVVIVNWNGGRYLDECLQNVMRQTTPPKNVLLMDNDSSDGSADRARFLKGITVIKLTSNLGFAAANNMAIEMCNTEFVALLNPDAFPVADWLENLISAAELHSEAAAFGSYQMNKYSPDTVDGTGDVYHLSGKVWRNRCGRIRNSSDGISREIFSPCAAAALYRRKALLQVGGFDEDYFCFSEDIDLGFRLRLAGYKAMYVPEAVVHHVGSVTTGGRRSDFSVYHGHRNIVWTFVKNMPGMLFWFLLPIHLMLNLITIILFTVRGQCRVIIKAKLDAIKHLPNILAKRKKIQKSLKVRCYEIWKALDISLIPKK